MRFEPCGQSKRDGFPRLAEPSVSHLDSFKREKRRSPSDCIPTTSHRALIHGVRLQYLWTESDSGGISFRSFRAHSFSFR